MPLLVNGEPVPDAAIAQQLHMLRASVASDAAGVDPRLLRIAEENAALQVLLRQEAAARFPEIEAGEIAAEIARRRGTTQSTTCSPSERSTIVLWLQTQRLIELLTRHVPRPPAREIEAAYTAQRDRFRLPELLRVRHIVANVDGGRDENAARQHMEDAHAALKTGEPFARVADRFSDCAGVGGDLGWIARGEMVPEFDEAVFPQKLNTVTDVFRTIFGFHIATVLERRAPRLQPLSEVRAQIARELHDERREAAVVTHLRELATRADIRMIEDPA